MTHHSLLESRRVYQEPCHPDGQQLHLQKESLVSVNGTCSDFSIGR